METVVTDCDLLVRKSRTRMQREKLRPSEKSLFVRVWGVMVFKADVQSTKSIGVHLLQMGEGSVDLLSILTWI